MNFKILFLAKVDYSNLTEGISNAFRKKSFITKIFDTKKYRKIDKYVNKNFSFRRFENCLKAYKPNAVFLIAPIFLKNEYYTILEYYKNKYRFFVIGWIGDLFNLSPENNSKIKLLDRIYYTDTGYFSILNNDKTSYLPLATDLQIFGKKRLTHKYDCSFVASKTLGRITTVSQF